MLFKNQIKARQLAEKKREERIQQQMEIAEHASNDKDINEVMSGSTVEKMAQALAGAQVRAFTVEE